MIRFDYLSIPIFAMDKIEVYLANLTINLNHM